MSSNLISRSSGQQTRKGFVAIQKNSPFFLPRYLMVGYLGFLFDQSSPSLYFDDVNLAYNVSKDGDISGDYDNWDIHNSYGTRPLRELENMHFL